ncbi:MAG: EamA family transporter [Patescibacteria group bacterium]|nr:EamA family transporter [Patescibacteria group bacterium]
MTTPIFLPLIFAIISPFIWGFMNVLDKFVVSHRVKNTLSFTIVAGIVNLAIGIILALFLNWTNIAINDLLFPAIAGLIFGSQFFLYYYMLGKEDVSNVIGFVYVYPIIVAILSFLFLNEKLSLISYFGMSMILLGVIFLSVKAKQIRLKVSLWMIISLIIVVALYEFFIKIATNNLPELNGIAISSICVGLIILPGLFNKKIRLGFPKELKNIKWALLNESLTFLGIFTTYFAMAGLPATIVSSIAATQPFAVLILESIAHKIGIKISVENNFNKNIAPILLIVFGVVLLYLPEIIALI